jgi:hypothetical protein
MVHNVGTDNDYQFDGCPKCGFGYGSIVNKDKKSDVNYNIGIKAWLNLTTLILFKEYKDLNKIKTYNKKALLKKIYNTIVKLDKTNENLLCSKNGNTNDTIFKYDSDLIDDYKNSDNFEIIK